MLKLSLEKLQATLMFHCLLRTMLTQPVIITWNNYIKKVCVCVCVLGVYTFIQGVQVLVWVREP